MTCKILIILTALLLSGCAGTEAMRSIQNSSLEAQDDLKIDRPVRFLGESKQDILDSKTYLFTHTASIIFALTEKMHPSIEDVVMEGESIGSRIVWKNEHGSVEGDGMRGGAACPITEDGYFLTAYHVLKDRITWMWTEQIVADPQNEGKLMSKDLLGKIRIVYADEKQDFAIVKVSYKVRHFLEVRESRLEKGEKVFGGGPWHNTGAGVAKSDWNVELNYKAGITKYRDITTSIPLAHGDSGSPLIDKMGNLCGVNYAGSSFKLWMFSQSRMADKASIMEIIENDRISNNKGTFEP